MQVRNNVRRSRDGKFVLRCTVGAAGAVGADAMYLFECICKTQDIYSYSLFFWFLFTCPTSLAPSADRIACFEIAFNG